MADLETSDKYPVRLNIGSNESIIIDKMYGPAVFDDLRITPDTNTAEWVIERYQWTNHKGGEETCAWVVIGRFPAEDVVNSSEVWETGDPDWDRRHPQGKMCNYDYCRCQQ
jgi:hypothetical protein